MSDHLDPSHPRQQLAFFVVPPVDHAARAAVAVFVSNLGALRTWPLGPPQYIDEHEVPDDQSHGDLCVDHVGGFIEFYSTLPPWTLPREIDREHLEEATAVLTALEKFSRNMGLNFQIYYANEVIGYINNGAMDEGIREVFLEEWKRSLEQSF